MMYGDFSETETSDKSIPVIFVVAKVSQILLGLVLRFLFLVKMINVGKSDSLSLHINEPNRKVFKSSNKTFGLRSRVRRLKTISEMGIREGDRFEPFVVCKQKISFVFRERKRERKVSV